MSKIRELFSTPKRAVISSACIVAVLAVIGTGTVFATEAATERSSIGRTGAEQRVLADAGVDPAAASFSRTEFERERGGYVYEVEFAADGVEYDYTVDASDGTVLAKETDGLPVSQPPVSQPSAATGEAISGLIGLEAAKQAALGDAGVSAGDVTYTKARLEYDDGIQVYDIEFYTATAEYEYEIAAETAAVADKSVEAFTGQQPASQPQQDAQQPQQDAQSAQGAYIGVDSAKQAAVAHAGTTLSDVTFKKAKLENDDGRAEYEIEFYKDGMEYEYAIDAVSGSILEYDSEYDD